MKPTAELSKKHWLFIISLVALLTVIISAAISYRIGLPSQWERIPMFTKKLGNHQREDQSGHGHDHDRHGDGGEHDHGHNHEGHDESEALELSELAWKNIGLKTGIVKLQNYVKTISIPAMVVERPGRSQVDITTPLTGIVKRIHPIEGEAVQPGQPLFDLRLTHEDLVTSQRDFLKSAQELDVVSLEVARLESAGEGVVAGRRVLERKYEQQIIKATMHAQRQGLLLHGISPQQIDEILKTRRLLQSLTVTAPPFDEDSHHHDVEHLYHVQRIRVKRGEHVDAGDSLTVLGDHCLLYVEGQAFEDDAERLIQAARERWSIDVDNGKEGETMSMEVFYVADQIDPKSRALRFYLNLPNTLIRDESDSGHRFVAWRFRPGQRMEVKIPLGLPWHNQIVLPPEAVIDEGTEAFVFEQNGNHFDRVPIHVVYRDKDAVVVENNGMLVGSTLAMSGAYQMHLALMNKVGGHVDPHAGHNH